MSGAEESDPEWRKSSNKKNNSKQSPDTSLKNPTPLQKFCDNWLQIFDPWLARCTDNANKPFCRACQRKLDCNRSHLQRHERTSKHARNLKILVEKGEEAARQNFKMRRERSKYYRHQKKLSALQASTDMLKQETAEETAEETAPETVEETAEDYIEEGYVDDDTFDYVQADESTDQFIEEPFIRQKSNAHNSSINASAVPHVPHKRNPSTSKKDRVRLLMQIQKDKNDIMSTFKDLLAAGHNSLSPPKEKSNVDLFFESVSSSVKALSPKLIAEAKMRVSQLVCELELRSLTEADHGNSVETVMAPGTIVVTPHPENSYVLHRTIEAPHEGHATQDYVSLH